jgi:hypothetical protein
LACAAAVALNIVGTPVTGSANIIDAAGQAQPAVAGDLTAVGAERAGNADGSIPPYTGGLAKTEPIDPKVGYTDPFAAEVPLYTISAANAAKYSNLLSAGHAALLKRDPRTFRMNVYPTHRSAAYPQDVLAEVKAQTGQSKTDGFHVQVAGKTTVPFPVPSDGLQVMWNHVFRWRGGSFERQYIFAPVQPSGAFFVVRLHQTVSFDQQGYMAEGDSRPGRLYNATAYYLSPPSAVGLRAATWEPIDPAGEERARWVFIPTTMDTRRLPSYEYDTQEPYTVGMRTADQNDGWNGTPDAYDWKLNGKRELLIGYNGYKLAARGVPYAAIIRQHNLDPDLLRYERHRVWVVEATRRKPHKYYRRIFYVDEDTWQVAQEEVYDKQGNLVRFGDHHMIQFYDVQVPWYAVTIHHTIGSGAYIVTYLNNQEPFTTRWGFKGHLVDYLPSRLRTLGLQ